MPALTLNWRDDYLHIHGDHIPGGPVAIHYLEAYCRPNSHTTGWVEHTVIPHRTSLVSTSPDASLLKLLCQVSDGITVDHTISTTDDEVTFTITAHNPTGQTSQAHWAQPCIRVGKFTGTGPGQTDDKYAYLPKIWVFLDGKLTTMPTHKWATGARYTPGQVWAAPGVPKADVNPRPLHPDVPSNGLIGATSGDGKQLFAVAFEPYQELFQGVIRCIHSDFRIGGLAPGETKTIRGKIYILPNDVSTLLGRYRKDFPEHSLTH